MKYQARHNTIGVFMGVSHGKGHYHLISECCRGLGVHCFDSGKDIARFLEGVGREELPPSARLNQEDFIFEPWDVQLHNELLEEGLREDCGTWLRWSLQHFPVGNN